MFGGTRLRLEQIVCVLAAAPFLAFSRAIRWFLSSQNILMPARDMAAPGLLSAAMAFAPCAPRSLRDQH